MAKSRLVQAAESGEVGLVLTVLHETVSSRSDLWMRFKAFRPIQVSRMLLGSHAHRWQNVRRGQIGQHSEWIPTRH